MNASTEGSHSNVIDVFVLGPIVVRLVGVLWPDRNEPDNARRSAISYVSRLRAALGEGVIATTEAFGILDSALRLWRGPTFGDLNSEWWDRSTGLVHSDAALKLNGVVGPADRLRLRRLITVSGTNYRQPRNGAPPSPAPASSASVFR